MNVISGRGTAGLDLIRQRALGEASGFRAWHSLKPISKCKASSVNQTVGELGAVRVQTLYSSI